MPVVANTNAAVQLKKVQKRLSNPPRPRQDVSADPALIREKKLSRKERRQLDVDLRLGAAARARDKIHDRLKEKILTREAEVVAQSLTCPRAYKPVRFASKFSAQKTAIANPWQVLNAPLDNTNTTKQNNAMLGPDALFACLFRHPVRNTVIYDANTAGATYNYSLWFENAGALSGALPPQLHLEDVDFVVANCQSTYQPHGQYLYPGYDKRGRRYFWLDGNATNPGTITGTPSATGVTGTFEVYEEDNEDVPVNAGTFSGTTPINVTVQKPGYYRIVQNVTGNTGSATINYTFSGNTSVFCHNLMPNLSINQGSVQGMRILSASLMFSNMASINTVQGQLAGYQAGQDEVWQQFALSSVGPYQQVAKSQGSETLLAANGMYTYLKPTQPADFDICKDLYVDEYGTTRMGFPLKSDSDYLVIAGSITVSGGRNGYITTCNGIEYVTQDVWREVECADMAEEAFNEAFNAIKEIPQIFENPTHLEKIWGWLKPMIESGTQAVIKYGPSVLSAAKLIGGMI